MSRSSSFISSHLSFKGRIPLWGTAISSFVIIVAVSIASGYRKAISDAVSELASDVVLTDTAAVRLDPELRQRILSTDGVRSVNGAVILPAVVQSGEELEGVIFKGVESADSALDATIPATLSSRLRLSEGDVLTAYFISDRVRVRKFRVSRIYTPPVELDGTQTVYVPLSDLQRVCGMSSNEASLLEVRLRQNLRTREGLRSKAAELSYVSGLHARSSAENYAQVFDWLQLVDANVVAVLLLMSLVAAFNMVSGFLVMVMRSSSAIGTLKALGMNNRGVASVFLKLSSRAVLAGLLLGNAAGLLFCLVQGTTHLLRLDPANYFLSYVPVSVNLPGILLADLFAYAVVMLILLIPARRISRIDPAMTIKSE